MNGLAGPLHGLANQEVIKWILEMREELGVDLPSGEQIEAYVKKTLSEGKVVPGYGHAVLRKTDPRFTAQMESARSICRMIHWCGRFGISMKRCLRSCNRWERSRILPNVDAHSGALLVHYGLVEYEFYTVLFGVSRALGYWPVSAGIGRWDSRSKGRSQ